MSNKDKGTVHVKVVSTTAARTRKTIAKSRTHKSKDIHQPKPTPAPVDKNPTPPTSLDRLLLRLGKNPLMRKLSKTEMYKFLSLMFGTIIWYKGSAILVNMGWIPLEKGLVFQTLGWILLLSNSVLILLGIDVLKILGDNLRRRFGDDKEDKQN
jgi:hypothetical protein